MKNLFTHRNFVLLVSTLFHIAVLQATPVKTTNTKCADKAFAKLKFEKAIKKYTAALAKGGDTVAVIQKIADSYRALNNSSEAEKWYAKLADLPKANPINKYYYAEALRSNKNYEAAQKYYEAYAKSLSNPAPVSAAISQMDKIPALAKENVAYKVDALKINSAKSDYAPAFYEDGKLIFTSNRSNKKAIYDKWNLNRYSKIYIATLDSTHKTEKTSLKSKCKTYESTAAFTKTNNELIFSNGSFKKKRTTLQNGKRLPTLQLYSVVLKENKGSKLTPLAVNGAYSSTQPTLSKDGKTLYFASDKLGGYGGTDLYISARDANGVWSAPQNLGPEINSAFDEKFPFVAEDGTLYFSSSIPSGLGGLDVYKTKAEKGSWLKPENLGAPVNSNKDDFSFIIDGANKNGYFASNRDGGMGEDDVYHFAYDETKLDYKVTIRVIDAVTQQAIAMASLGIDCKTGSPENTLTDKSGERIFTFKAGKTCVVEAMSSGYKPNSAEVTSQKKNSVVILPLKQDVIKLLVTVKEKETSEPIREVAISLTPVGQPSMNYATGEKGDFSADIPNGKYTVTSPDFTGIKGEFSDADVDATGMVKLNFLIPHSENIINVPLTANCFSSTVTITNIKTGEKNEVTPNTNGEVRLDLKLNSRFLVEHNGRADTISTVGLKPGMNVDGPCKFYVGQTWVVHNIYYDLDKWIIRKDAAKELDRLVQVMKENPTLEIELGSHTDCRASAKYNVVLSARRARAAVEYIVSKGIKAKRILAAGYGETMIHNGCICEPTNESSCTAPQHQINRRTEVKVLRY